MGLNLGVKKSIIHLMYTIEMDKTAVAAWLEKPADLTRFGEDQQKQDMIFERLHEVSDFQLLHVDPNSFRRAKTRREKRNILVALGKRPVENPAYTEMAVRNMLWEDIDPSAPIESGSADGYIKFEPSRLYLAYSLEEVRIPDNELWRMRSHFILDDTYDLTSLRTNLTAPNLRPGSQGKQTYEIINESKEALDIEVSRLICLTAVLKVRRADTSPSNLTFAVQTGQRPSLGTSFF